MTEYNRMAKGRFTSTGQSEIINLPFKPDYVELINLSIMTTPAANSMQKAYWDCTMGQGTALMDVVTSIGPVVQTTDSVATNGISTFSAGLMLQFGAAQNIDTITAADPPVVTAAAAHGLKSGDVIIMSNIYQTAATGMQQIAGIPFTVTVTGATTFTIDWNANQANYTAYNSGVATSQATFVKVLFPYLYFPGDNIISRISTGATTTIHTTTAHNFVVGQEVAFRIPTVWGTTQLNSLPNTTIPGSPIYGYVISVTDYNTFVVNIDSSNYTAFDTNQPFINFPGQTFAQVVAVGDVNTGGVQISAGSQLYPPPYSRPIANTLVNTINGPAIQGAYVNNTSQGFIVGSGVGVTNANVVLAGTAGNTILWRAYLHDIGSCN